MSRSSLPCCDAESCDRLHEIVAPERTFRLIQPQGRCRDVDPPVTADFRSRQPLPRRATNSSHEISILFCCLFALLLNPVTAQDPVKVSPQYYKVLLDNDEMRVLEVRIKPGEKEPMHSHPPGVVYALSEAKVKSTSPDGKSEEIAMKTGEARWREATTHAVENIGTTDIRALVVESRKAKK